MLITFFLFLDLQPPSFLPSDTFVDKVTISWSKAVSPLVTHYQLECFPFDTSITDQVHKTRVNKPGVSHTFENLLPDTYYQCRIRSETPNSFSLWTNTQFRTKDEGNKNIIL